MGNPNKPETDCGARAVGEAIDEGMRILGGEARTSGKTALRDLTNSLRQRADQLDALADSLPEKLPPEADDALLRVVLAAGRAGI